MISKSQIKLITGLQKKKYRDNSGLFVAEGPKVISELLNAGFTTDYYFSTEAAPSEGEEVIPVSERELKKISSLKTPNTSLAVFRKPGTPELREKGLILALDAIRDPGNLGTIIRLCDWFGVEQIICSEDTVDCYNPKVIQASMGSIARVAVHYVDLNSFLKSTQLGVVGAVMDGNSVYETSLPSEGILVMGNEANGISETINKSLNLRVTIPRFGNIQETESLNVATATAILLNEFRRSTGK